MSKTSTLNLLLEDLSKEEDNQTCFDCNKIPAQWASINNGIFLCLECSGEHRGFGVSTSYIRSISLDTWNNNQVELMRIGGNKKLRDFLRYCGVPQDNKKTLYTSKLLNYYRKMLKAQSVGEDIDIDIPARNEMLEPYTGQTTSNQFENNRELGNKKISLIEENRNKFNGYSNDYTDNSRIGEGHYIQSGSKIYDFPDENNSNSSNSYKEGKFTNVSKSNDPRFASISSVPIESLENDEQQNGYSSKVYSILGTALNVTKSVASTVKDKMHEYELGDKLYYAGGKTADILYSASYRIYEKGSEIAKSETVSSIAQTAKSGISSGLTYIYGKFFKPANSEGSESYNSNQISSENYNRTGNYNTEPTQYVKLDENFKEKFLDN